MGVRVEVAPSGGFTSNPRDSTFLSIDTYSLSESSTPLSGSDSSGSVGTVSFNVPYRDDYVLLHNRDIRITTVSRGITEGFISAIGRSDEGGNVPITVTLRTGRLNLFNIQAQPFIGTLAGAFGYYLSLGNQSTRYQVDPEIASRQVAYRGWNGELWYYLKQLAAAQDADINLVSGIIVLRPIRTRTMVEDHDATRSLSVSDAQLAQSVDVNYYNSKPITNQLVYPPGGWTPEVVPITIGAGETRTETVTLSSSVTSVAQPTIQTYVSRTHRSSSVFTVVGDDGLPITPTAWRAGGGSLKVEINPDTVSLDVVITAPTGLRSITGEPHNTYSIALGDDGGRFSTLRIVGTGVAFDKQVMNVGTGIGPTMTSQDVGATVDNVFLSTAGDAYKVALRTAREFSGGGMNLSYGVSAVNRFDNPGNVSFTSNDMVDLAYPGTTWTNDMFDAEFAGKSNFEVDDFLSNLTPDDGTDQVIGNVGGARIWDRRAHHWFRIRTANITPGVVSGEADIDTTHGDGQGHWAGMTYGQIEELFVGKTYGEVERLGLIG